MEATDHDLQLFHDCFVANGSPRSLEMLRWQYFEPKAGPLLVDLALTRGPSPRLAAIYAVCPMTMHAMGRRVLGLQSLNTLTDEAFRGRGLFVSMATALYERSKKIGAEMVYGFPNGNSAHGIFKRLQWETLDPMPIVFRPMRTGYLLKKLRLGTLAKMFDLPLAISRAPKLPAGYELRTMSDATESFTAVWEQFARAFDYAVAREADFLKWRLRRPDAQYEIVGLFAAERLVGFGITGVTTSPDGDDIGKVMELVFDPANTHAAQLLAEEMMHRLKKRGCAVAWAWNFEHSPNHAALRRVGFVALPRRLQPLEAHAGVRAFNPTPNFGKRERWYLSLLDSDTD